MRREFIFILLGIITFSTLSSILSGSSELPSKYIFLDSVNGDITAGNFSYWQLGHTGALLIELNSISGDADLYISDGLRPSYEVDGYNFSSTTCGLETVDIPASFPRPIGVGVFGHWSHEVTKYTIHVFYDTTAADDVAEALEEQTPLDSVESQKIVNSGEPTHVHKEPELSSKYLKLFDLLDTVLEVLII